MLLVVVSECLNDEDHDDKTLGKISTGIAIGHW